MKTNTPKRPPSLLARFVYAGERMRTIAFGLVLSLLICMPSVRASAENSGILASSHKNIASVPDKGGKLAADSKPNAKAIAPPVFDYPPTPADSSTICLRRGQLYSATIQAHSPDPNTSVQIVSGTVPLGNPIFSTPLPTPAGNSTSTFMGLFAIGFGPYHVSFTAKDALGQTASTSWDIIVDDPPRFLSNPPANASVYQGYPFTYNIGAFDADMAQGDTLTFIPVTMPAWLSLRKTGPSKAKLTGTPGAGDIGTNQVVIGLKDRFGKCYGTITQSFKIEVAPCNVQIAESPAGGSYCPGTKVVLTASPGNIFSWNTGATTSSITVTAGASTLCTVKATTGNCVATANVTILGVDTIAPVAHCKNTTVVLNANGTATITAAQINNGSTDNCGIKSITASPMTFGCKNIGKNSVTLLVTDANGNHSSCTATVTVIDSIAPVARCKNITVQLDSTGKALITAAQVNNGSSDNCSIKTMTVSPDHFNCDNTGMRNVTLTVTDSSGNSDKCTSVVTILAPKPVAKCKDISVKLDNTGKVTLSGSQVDNGSKAACGIRSLVVNPASFGCANIGRNLVTLTVTDNSGNISTCTSTVTVYDSIRPVAHCKDITVKLGVGGSATITAAQINNGSSDNCGIKSITASPLTFGCRNIGKNSVTLKVIDGSGNSSTCTSTVTVVDSIAPVARCKSIIIQLDSTGHATITAAQIDNGSSDNCHIKTITVSPDHFSCINAGPNTVTLTVTDSSGNSDKCSAVVTILGAKPQAHCKDIAVSLDSSGKVKITPSMINNGSVAACNIRSLTVKPNIFGCDNIGMHQVTLTLTDINGLISTCTSNVKVTDSLKPVARCKDLTVSLGTNGTATITVAQIDNGSTDNCGIKTYSIKPARFDCRNVGKNTVTLMVTDAAGNISSCTSTVTVEDHIAPEARCKPALVKLNANGNASITAADINFGSYDNCGIVSMTATPSTFTCANIGPNRVTLIVKDASGNSDTCSTLVLVVDPIAPEARCKNITVALDSSGKAHITAAQVNNGSSDNCSIVSMHVFPNHFTCSDIGPHRVYLIVVDAGGNVDSCSSIVTVKDTIAPEARCKNITVSLDSTGHVQIKPGMINNASTDNCGIRTITVSPMSFSCDNMGENTVTLVVTDASGNSSKCTSLVSVRDSIKPIAKCKDITVKLDSSGNANIKAGQVNDGSTDNCGIASIGVQPNHFSCSNRGINSVTLTVTDQAGNTSTCTAHVKVIDVLPPVARCKAATAYLDSTGHVRISPAMINNGSSDNCGIKSLVVHPDHFDCTSTGLHAVTLVVTDSTGNVDSCTAQVNIINKNAPVARCQPTTISLLSGISNLTPAMIDNGSNALCGIAKMSVAPASFNCQNLGINQVTLTVTDIQGNTSTCKTHVNVLGVNPNVSVCSKFPFDSTYLSQIWAPDTLHIYLGYGPQKMNLSAVAAGGANFSYSWTGKDLSTHTGANTVFKPTGPGNFTISVNTINEFGCTGSGQIMICVMDVRVPNSGGGLVYVCHNGPKDNDGDDQLNLPMNPYLAALLLKFFPNDHLGMCNQTCGPGVSVLAFKESQLISVSDKMQVLAYPNPFSEGFHLQVQSSATEPVVMHLYSITGQLLQTMNLVNPQEDVILGHDLANGLYLLEVEQGGQKKVVKIRKAE
jgi:hypothetical protein